MVSAVLVYSLFHMFGFYSHSLLKHFCRPSLHMNCRKSVRKLKDKHETMILLIQEAADAAWNYDIVIHSPTLDKQRNQ